MTQIVLEPRTEKRLKRTELQTPPASAILRRREKTEKDLPLPKNHRTRQSQLDQRLNLVPAVPRNRQERPRSVERTPDELQTRRRSQVRLVEVDQPTQPQQEILSEREMSGKHQRPKVSQQKVVEIMVEPDGLPMEECTDGLEETSEKPRGQRNSKR